MKNNLFNYSVNVAGLIKNKRRYGMAIAWCTQVDYDKVLLCFGEQSATGKVIEKGDLLGLSGLSVGQKEIADHFGNSSSADGDKFEGVSHTAHSNQALLIDGAYCQMVIEVLEVLHLSQIEDTNVVYGHVKEAFFDENKEKMAL
jgi:flavin reductase (DIM6/NTAB) family NADH-FMN oxidoreductase RutF